MELLSAVRPFSELKCMTEVAMAAHSVPALLLLSRSTVLVMVTSLYVRLQEQDQGVLHTEWSCLPVYLLKSGI